MKIHYLFSPLILLIASCNQNKKKENTMQSNHLKEEMVSYTLDSITRNNFVVYDDNIKGPRPAVMVLHEWWGLNDYAKMRARELAKLGYIAMAVDMYGDHKMGNDPTAAEALASPFYAKPEIAVPIFNAAIEKIKGFAQTDTNNIAAIGYCFGGAQVLNLARLGENLKGVVSFHGNVIGVTPDKSLLKASVLVCHGGADPYVSMEEINTFKKQMDSIGAKYDVKIYEGATHSFTNPNSTEIGKKYNMSIEYNPAADSNSWNDMKLFFKNIFN